MADKSTIEITGDSSNLDEAVDRAFGTFQEFGEHVESIADKVRDYWDRSMDAISSGLRSAWEYVTRYITDLFDRMWARIQDGAKRFVETQSEVVRTEAMLKATGNAAGFAAGELEKMNKAMQGLSVHGSTALRSAQQVLLEYRNVRGDVFVAAIQGAMDLAAITGDLTSATREFGKALNNPIKGLHDLVDSGVTFTDAETEAINKMIEANDVIGVQHALLEKLQQLFGGAAAAQANTLAGQMARLDNVFDDIYESLGSLLVPVLTEKFIPAAQAAARVVRYVVDQISSSGSQIGDYWDEGVKIALEWLDKLIDGATTGFTYVQTVVKNFGDFFESTWNKVKAVSMTALANLIDLLLDWSQKAVDTVPVIAEAFKNLWNTMIDYAKTAIGGLKEGWVAFKDYFRKVLENMWDNFQHFWDLMKGRLAGVNVGEFKWTSMVDGFKGALEKIKGIGGDVVGGKIDVRKKLGLDDFVKGLRDDADALLGGFNADAQGRFDKAFDANLKKNRDRVQQFRDKLDQIINGKDNPSQNPSKDPFKFDADKDKDSSDRDRSGGFEDLLALNRRIQGAALGSSPEEKAIKEQSRILKGFASDNISQGKQLINVLTHPSGPLGRLNPFGDGKAEPA